MYERQRIVEQWSSEPNLDALRAFAVSCVVARHLLTWFEVSDRPWLRAQALGLFGVLIFFVHTSLVLMLSLERQQARRAVSNASLYLSFVIRRVFRIYPLAMAAVLLTYFCIVPLHDPSAPRAGIVQSADTAMFLSDLFLVQDLTGAGSILAPLWSLPAEVEMYLLLPLLFFWARARGRRGILLGAWPLAVVWALASWRMNLSLGAGRFASCFVAGVVCYTMVGERRRLPFWTLPLALVGGLGVYMVAYARVGMQAGLGIPATIGLALLLPLFERMKTSWLRRASHVVANYSYGIYLFHAPCIWIAFGKLKFLGTAGCAATFVLLLAATTWVFYHSLEAPMIRLGQRVAARVS